jgi:hypothetical protein
MVGQPLYIGVGTSAAIKDQKFRPDLTVRDAVVKLYVNDTLTETLVFDNMFGYHSGIPTLPGNKYSVTVSAPSYDNAFAVTVAPSVVNIVSVTRTPMARKNEDGEYQDAVTLTFDDPAGMGDFYVVSVNAPQDSFIYNHDFCVNSPDASVETNATDLADVNTCLDNKSIFIRDALFNGSRKQIKFYANSAYIQPVFNGIDSIYSTIELMHVTEDYFKYSKSARIAEETNENPFAEPVNVYSNITNGLGIFSILSIDGRQIR